VLVLLAGDPASLQDRKNLRAVLCAAIVKFGCTLVPHLTFSVVDLLHVPLSLAVCRAWCVYLGAATSKRSGKLPQS